MGISKISNPFSAMKSPLTAITFRPSLFFLTPSHGLTSLSLSFRNSIFLRTVHLNSSFFSLTSQSNPNPLFIALCSKSSDYANTNLNRSSESAREAIVDDESETQWSVDVGNPSVYVPAVAKLSLSDQAFFLLAFIACSTSVAFTSLVIAAVPTLYAMGRAATSLSKLADTAREELPSTMAAIRLSGMEISDLTLELSDMSKEISDGVNKSAQAVQAAEAGIRQIGSHAREQTMAMIQERASLPIISLQPVVAGAAKKTSHAVGQATRSFLNMISRKEFTPENEEDFGIDRVEV